MLTCYVTTHGKVLEFVTPLRAGGYYSVFVPASVPFMQTRVGFAIHKLVRNEISRTGLGIGFRRCLLTKDCRPNKIISSACSLGRGCSLSNINLNSHWGNADHALYFCDSSVSVRRRSS